MEVVEFRGGGTIACTIIPFFCPSIHRRRRGSFPCATRGLFPVKAMVKGATPAYLPLKYRQHSSCDMQNLFSCETCRYVQGYVCQDLSLVFVGSDLFDARF